MGAVFRAELGGPGGFCKPIALKVLHPQLAAANRRTGVNLLREARLGALLHHPGIVEIYDFGTTRGRDWISMEFVDGIELSDLIRGVGALPPTAVLDIVIQAAEALDYAHTLQHQGRSAGFVHRDLKPSNLLVTDRGVVKIADFGIAQSALITGATTRTGITKGTPAYMSPEQVHGGRVDGRADLFSVGVILYQMLTGRRLFRGRTPAATVLAVLDVDLLLAQPETLAEADAHLPGAAYILRGCLQKEPGLRLSSAAELLEALRTLELRTAPGPNLREFLASLPRGGRHFRGLRAVAAGRAPAAIPGGEGRSRTLLPGQLAGGEATEAHSISGPFAGLPVVPAEFLEELGEPTATSARPRPRFALGLAAGLVLGLTAGLSAGLALARLGLEDPPASSPRVVVLKSAEVPGPEAPGAAAPGAGSLRPTAPTSAAPPPDVRPPRAAEPRGGARRDDVRKPEAVAPSAAKPAPDPIEAAPSDLEPAPGLIAPPSWVPAARSATHTAPTTATVGRPTTLQVDTEPHVVAVHAFVARSDAVWERRALDPQGEGRWLTDLWVTPSLADGVAYYFEITLPDGQELLGSPESPHTISVEP